MLVQRRVPLTQATIAFLGDRPEIRTAAERLRGYEQGHERGGLAIHPAQLVLRGSKPQAPAS